MSTTETPRAAPTVEVVSEVREELVPTLEDLISKLGREPTSRGVTVETLEAIVAAQPTRLLVARDPDGSIVGTATLAVVRTPTQIRASIHDVVVFPFLREQGVGATLVREALRLAELSGAKSMELGQTPRAREAKRFFEKLGFRKHEIDIYRAELGATGA